MKPELSKYDFLLEYAKRGNPVNIVKDANGLFTFCLGHLCLNCSMNRECNIDFGYSPARLTTKDYYKMKQEYPELFI